MDSARESCSCLLEIMNESCVSIYMEMNTAFVNVNHAIAAISNKCDNVCIFISRSADGSDDCIVFFFILTVSPSHIIYTM